MAENLKVLEVQVESAKHHLQGKPRAVDDLLKVHERCGKVCAICHTSGHNRAKCNKIPSENVNFYKDKHPELMNDICTLQHDLKEHENEKRLRCFL